MHESLQPAKLGERNGPPVRSELVIAPTIALTARATIGGVDNETVADQAVQRPVQRPRAHLHRAIAQFSDPPHQCVPVELTIEKSESDMQRRRRQRLGRLLHARSMIYRLSIVKRAALGSRPVPGVDLGGLSRPDNQSSGTFHGFAAAKLIRTNRDARQLTSQGTLYKSLGRLEERPGRPGSAG